MIQLEIEGHFFDPNDIIKSHGFEIHKDNKVFAKKIWIRSGIYYRFNGWDSNVKGDHPTLEDPIYINMVKFNLNTLN